MNFCWIFLLLITRVASAQQCLLEPFCTCDVEQQSLDCRNFDSFSQLDFKTNQIAWKSVVLSPRVNSIKLNANLNLDGLKLNTTAAVMPVLRLNKISSFDIDYNPFKKIELVGERREFDLAIGESRWLFESSTSASATEFCSFSTSRDFIFSNLVLNKFEMNQADLIASSRFCPLIFYNSTIGSIEIIRPSGRLNFVPVLYGEDTNETLDIVVHRLAVSVGLTAFPRVLTAESLLNYDLFSAIKSLEIEITRISYINENDLIRFRELKQLKLINVGLDQLLKNGTEWLMSLNSDIGTDNETLSQEMFDDQVFRIIVGGETSLNFEDDDLCLFERFPHDRFVVALISNPKRISCSCTVYWLFKEYGRYKPFLTSNDMASVPTQCLDVDQVLIDEQLEYCELEKRLNECNGTTTDDSTEEPASTTTTTQKPKSCIDDRFKCTCNFEYFNYLECSDSTIMDVPDDFGTADEVKWNYVTFVGSSIATINEFNALQLDKNAVLYVKNVSTFGARLFSKILTETKFQFIVESSDLFSLGRNLVFINANLSLLEFTDCSFTSFILVNAFQGADIDSLMIKSPRNVSFFFGFRPQPLFSVTVIRKFKIDRAYNAFDFGVDFTRVPYPLFSRLEELDISNTVLSYIEKETIINLPNLHTIKFDNVSLARMIENSNEDDEDESGNWLAASQIKRLFIGREYQNGFTFQDKYLCYFLNMHDEMKVYIYDSIDFINGPACTCTVLWMYRNLDFSSLDSDDEYSDYVPKCIKRMGNKENIAEGLKKCFNELDPVTYCKQAAASETTTKTETTSTSSSSSTVISSTTPTVTSSSNTISSTTTTTTTPKKESTIRDDVLFYGFIAVSVLILLILLVLLILYVKISRTRKLFKRLAVYDYSMKIFTNGNSRHTTATDEF